MTQRNVLFIMCDQLRADYLSCYGHPSLATPAIDSLAARGVRFARAYCQAPLCGPSRASFYTGRAMSSHGVMSNEDPLKIGELTLGDYMGQLGLRALVIGKSEAWANRAALERLAIDPQSDVGRRIAHNGFEALVEHAGLYPDPILPADLAYNAYLREQGFDGENPWELYANTALDETGAPQSGWLMRNAGLPARVPAKHSETAFTTRRALEFLDRVEDGQPWCLHLSYIKPHWPYLAPAPYHALFGAEDILPARRSEEERLVPHPVFKAFMDQDYSLAFAREEVRRRVVPTYMGLIKEVDDNLAQVLSRLEEKGLMETTMIVFTSDHGDYLGDHWLGEKDLFHEPSVRIPMIVCDPSPEADATRGSVDERLVEAIDLMPTFIEFAGGQVATERLEGRSLLPLLHKPDGTEPWRDHAVSEIDYSDRGPRGLLGLHPYDCRAYMIRTADWKYIHHERFRPQLFDLRNDPDEFEDLGADPAREETRRELGDALFAWFRRRLSRTEMPETELADMGPERDEGLGIKIGHW